VRVRKALQEREKGFDADEADIILQATLGKPSGHASAETVAARRWIPWICAYTGARVNEITPLTGRDFVSRAGIPMIRICAQNSKTRKFREVPIYSHLIEQGLLLYASRGAHGPCSTILLGAAEASHRTRTSRKSAKGSPPGFGGLKSILTSRQTTDGGTVSPRSPASSPCRRMYATPFRDMRVRKSPTNTVTRGHRCFSARLRSCQDTWRRRDRPKVPAAATRERTPSLTPMQPS
jgi:hypothetical protein